MPRWGLGRAFPELGMLLEPVGILPGTADHPCGAGPRCLKLIPALPTPGKLAETPLGSWGSALGSAADGLGAGLGEPALSPNVPSPAGRASSAGN